MSKVQIPRLQFPKIIKDPILDYVPLTDLEYRILQLPVFNRLHDLKQTSMAYLASYCTIGPHCGFVARPRTRAFIPCDGRGDAGHS